MPRPMSREEHMREFDREEDRKAWGRWVRAASREDLERAAVSFDLRDFRDLPDRALAQRVLEAGLY